MDYIDKKIILLSSVVKSRKGNYQELFQQTIKKGFTQCRIDGKIEDISNSTSLERYKNHDIEIVIDKLFLEKNKLPILLLVIIFSPYVFTAVRFDHILLILLSVLLFLRRIPIISLSFFLILMTFK